MILVDNLKILTHHKPKHVNRSRSSNSFVLKSQISNTSTSSLLDTTITESYYLSNISHLQKEITSLYKIFAKKVKYIQEEQLKKIHQENESINKYNQTLNASIQVKVIFT